MKLKCKILQKKCEICIAIQLKYIIPYNTNNVYCYKFHQMSKNGKPQKKANHILINT